MTEKIDIFENIPIFSHNISGCKATTMCIDDDYAIFIDYDKIETSREEICVLSHELGHCYTGATHKLHSRFELLEKHEYSANKWAVHFLIPFDQLMCAVKKGYTQTYELAEYFNVTEDFITLTYDIYKREGYLI